MADDEAKITVRLDTTAAQRDLQQLRDRFERFAQGVGRSVAMAGTAVQATLAAGITGILGPTADIARQTIFTELGRIGRALPIGMVVARRAAGVEAEEAAKERTIAMFGRAGLTADPEQIKSVYQQFLNIERQEKEARVRLEDAIVRKQSTDQINKTIDDMTFAVQNLTLVLKELINVITGSNIFRTRIQR